MKHTKIVALLLAIFFAMCPTAQAEVRSSKVTDQRSNWRILQKLGMSENTIANSAIFDKAIAGKGNLGHPRKNDIVIFESRWHTFKSGKKQIWYVREIIRGTKSLTPKKAIKAPVAQKRATPAVRSAAPAAKPVLKAPVKKSAVSTIQPATPKEVKAVRSAAPAVKAPAKPIEGTSTIQPAAPKNTVKGSMPVVNSAVPTWAIDLSSHKQVAETLQAQVTLAAHAASELKMLSESIMEKAQLSIANFMNTVASLKVAATPSPSPLAAMSVVEYPTQEELDAKKKVELEAIERQLVANVQAAIEARQAQELQVLAANAVTTARVLMEKISSLASKTLTITTSVQPAPIPEKQEENQSTNAEQQPSKKGFTLLDFVVIILFLIILLIVLLELHSGKVTALGLMALNALLARAKKELNDARFAQQDAIKKFDENKPAIDTLSEKTDTADCDVSETQKALREILQKLNQNLLDANARVKKAEKQVMWYKGIVEYLMARQSKHQVLA